MDLDLAKPIDITDKPLFDEYILKFPPEISELSFTNIFMWRNHYNFRFFEWKDHLLLFSRNPNKIFFFPPIKFFFNQLVFSNFIIESTIFFLCS